MENKKIIMDEENISPINEDKKVNSNKDLDLDLSQNFKIKKSISYDLTRKNENLTNRIDNIKKSPQILDKLNSEVILKKFLSKFIKGSN